LPVSKPVLFPVFFLTHLHRISPYLLPQDNNMGHSKDQYAENVSSSLSMQHQQPTYSKKAVRCLLLASSLFLPAVYFISSSFV